MADYREKIQYLFDFATSGEKKLDQTREKFQQIGVTMDKTTNFIDKTTQKYISQTKALNKLNQRSRDYNFNSVQQMTKSNKQFAKLASSLDIQFKKTKEGIVMIDKYTKNEIRQTEAKKRAQDMSKKLTVTQEDMTNKTQRYTQAMQEASVRVEEIPKYLDSATGAQLTNDEMVSRVTEKYQGFSKVMELSNEEFKAMYPLLSESTHRMTRFAARTRNATVGMEGFRSELLSLLFFGMFLTNMMKTLTGRSAETMGIFQIWGTTLELLFLPIMEAILPFFISLLDAVVAMPDSIKLVIGAFVILAGILGFLFTIFATLTFGIGGIISNLGVLAPVVKFVSGVFAGLSVTIGIVIAAILVIIISFIDAFRRNFLGIRDFVQMIWNGIKNIVSGVFDFFAGILGVFVGLFTGDMEKVKSSFERIWTGIKKFGLGIVELIIGFFGSLVISIINIFYRIGEAVSNMFAVIWELLKEFASSGWEAGKDFVSSLVDGIKSAPGRLINAIKSILPDWALNAVNIASGTASSIGSSISSSIPSFNDFVWRAGEGAAKINPNDNLVGFKGAPPNLGGGQGANVNLTVNYDIKAGDNNEMRRLIDENNRKLLGEVRRLL